MSETFFKLINVNETDIIFIRMKMKEKRQN